MTKLKHPTNRYERKLIKEIKDGKHPTDRYGLRHKLVEAEVVKELDHELVEEQVCS